MSLSQLQQRQQVCRAYRPYPGKLPRPYHQILHGASTPSLFNMHSWARPGGHGASAKLFKVAAVVLSLALCFMAAAAWSAALSHITATTANGQSARLEARPASWAAAFTSFAARASGVTAEDTELSVGAVFEIAVTAAPAEKLFGNADTSASGEQIPPGQTVPDTVVGGLKYELPADHKAQAAHAVGEGKAGPQEVPAQAAVMELPPVDPSSKAAAVACSTVCKAL